MKKIKRFSAEDLDEVIASHFGHAETVEADEDEDLDDVTADDEDDDIADDEEDILDEDSEDEDSEDDSEDEDSEDEDLEGDDLEDSEDDDLEGDDEDSEDEDSEDEVEADEDEDLDEEDFLDVDGEDEDEDSEDEVTDEDGLDDVLDEDEDFDAESSEDEDEEDFSDIDEVLASVDDPVEAMIASGAVAVIIPVAPHDYAEVRAAFDNLEDSEDEDEEFEVDASEDDDSDSEDEGEDEEEVTTDEDSEDEDSEDEDFEADEDEDEDLEDDSEGEDSEDDEEDEDVTADEDEDLEDDEDFEADASDEDSEDAEDEDAEHFHPVADMEMIAEASADDVELVLYAQANEAWWNVIVAGVPAARISKDALSPEVHEFFVQDKFAQNVKEAIASEGLLPVLQNMSADFYATAYLQSELADEIRSEVEATASEDVTERAANLREDFLEAVTLATAGTNKNYWPKIGSPLKSALFEELTEAGVDNAAEIIEAAFASAGDAHFEAITAKAIEIMDKSPEYREELKEAIADAGVIDHQPSKSEDEEEVATASVLDRITNRNSRTGSKIGDRLGGFARR